MVLTLIFLSFPVETARFPGQSGPVLQLGRPGQGNAANYNSYQTFGAKNNNPIPPAVPRPSNPASPSSDGNYRPVPDLHFRSPDNSGQRPAPNIQFTQTNNNFKPRPPQSSNPIYNFRQFVDQLSTADIRPQHQYINPIGEYSPISFTNFQQNSDFFVGQQPTPRDPSTPGVIYQNHPLQDKDNYAYLVFDVPKPSPPPTIDNLPNHSSTLRTLPTASNSLGFPHDQFEEEHKHEQRETSHHLVPPPPQQTEATVQKGWQKLLQEQQRWSPVTEPLPPAPVRIEHANAHHPASFSTQSSRPPVSPTEGPFRPNTSPYGEDQLVGVVYKEPNREVSERPRLNPHLYAKLPVADYPEPYLSPPAPPPQEVPNQNVQRPPQEAIQLNVQRPQQILRQNKHRVTSPTQEIPQQNVYRVPSSTEEVPQQNVHRLQSSTKEVPQQNVYRLISPTEEVPQQNIYRLTSPTEEVPQQNVYRLPGPTQEVPRQNVHRLPSSTEEVPRQNVYRVPSSIQEVSQQNVHTLQSSTEEVPQQNIHRLPSSTQEVLYQNVHRLQSSTKEVPQHNVYRTSSPTEEVPRQNVLRLASPTQEVPRQNVHRLPSPTQEAPRQNVHRLQSSTKEVPQQNVQKSLPSTRSPITVEPNGNSGHQPFAVQNREVVNKETSFPYEEYERVKLPAGAEYQDALYDEYDDNAYYDDALPIEQESPQHNRGKSQTETKYKEETQSSTRTTAAPEQNHRPASEDNFPRPPTEFYDDFNKYSDIHNPFASFDFDFDEYLDKLRGKPSSTAKPERTQETRGEEIRSKSVPTAETEVTTTTRKPRIRPSRKRPAGNQLASGNSDTVAGNNPDNPNPLTVPFYPGEDGNFYANPSHFRSETQSNDYYKYGVEETQTTEGNPSLRTVDSTIASVSTQLPVQEVVTSPNFPRRAKPADAQRPVPERPHPFSGSSGDIYEEVTVPSTEFTPPKPVVTQNPVQTKPKKTFHQNYQSTFEENDTFKPVRQKTFPNTATTTEYITTSSTQYSTWDPINSWQHNKDELTTTQPKYSDPTTTRYANSVGSELTSTLAQASSTRPTNELLESLYDIAKSMFGSEHEDKTSDTLYIEPSSEATVTDEVTTTKARIKTRRRRPLKTSTSSSPVTEYPTTATNLDDHTTPETYTVRRRPTMRQRVRKPITTTLPSNDIDTTFTTTVKSTQNRPPTGRRYRRPNKTTTEAYADNDKSESYDRPLQDNSNKLDKKPPPEEGDKPTATLR